MVVRAIGMVLVGTIIAINGVVLLVELVAKD